MKLPWAELTFALITCLQRPNLASPSTTRMGWPNRILYNPSDSDPAMRIDWLAIAIGALLGGGLMGLFFWVVTQLP